MISQKTQELVYKEVACSHLYLSAILWCLYGNQKSCGEADSVMDLNTTDNGFATQRIRYTIHRVSD